MKQKRIPQEGITPSPSIKNAVRAIVDERGVAKAAAMLGIGREATTRIAAGVGVRQGTLALVERALAELKK